MTRIAPDELDVAIIGAGFSGLYAVYRLRDRFRVRCFEAGGGVGGTWYWNRYPGARVDIQSMEYSYGFDEALQQDWTWPEQFSAQADIERYANHVADRFGLRENISLSSRVESLRYDEAIDRWRLRTTKDGEVVCKYVIAATGSLSAPNTPPWPGREKFKGEVYHTAAWPREGLDLAGKRVGFIGTGSTGIQAMPLIAEDAAQLVVFQRTPAFCMPSGNRPMDPAHERDWKANYRQRRGEMLDSYGASLIEYPLSSAHDLTAEQREETLERAWSSQSAFQLLFCFNDVMTDPVANDYVAEFVRKKIRGIVKDPVVAERLSPRGYPIGGKRLCIGNGYFEMFNRDNVSLVDVRAAPIVAFTETGLRTTDAEYELDVVITATGFDAVTGAMTRIDIEGVGGRKLVDKWAEGPTAYLGAMVAGFPNLFMIHGPMTPAAQAQMITTGEWQVNWTADVIEEMERSGLSRIDTTEEAESWWGEQTEAASHYTVHRLADSWYNGRNIEGKKSGFMIYVGGFPQFAAICNDVVREGYRGFVRS